MNKIVELGGKKVGNQEPVYIIAEIGINHNGDINLAKKLIDLAIVAGCDAVKFQKRNPESCVPDNQKDVKKMTPWGNITYLEYRHFIEFCNEDYNTINEYCKSRGIDWFVSCWDTESVDFMENFDPICYKIPSACLTYDTLLRYVTKLKKPILISTGMSTMKQIRHAISILSNTDIIIMHSTSTYPCKPSELNLNMIRTLKSEFDRPIGYSGHETGLQTTYAAVALGACLVERHITLNRYMWGTDQLASVEGSGLLRLVRDIRIIEESMGDGIKKVYDSEKKIMSKLRKY